MKKSLRTLILVAGIASITALGGSLALAVDTSAAPGSDLSLSDHHDGSAKGKHGHRDMKRHFAKLAAKLGLNDQQKAQAKAIFEANRAEAKPLFASLKNERHQLRTLIHSGTADEAAVRAQSAKVAAVQADLAVQRAKGAKQLMALLTPDQQSKLKALEKKHEERFEKGGMKMKGGMCEEREE